MRTMRWIGMGLALWVLGAGMAGAATTNYVARDAVGANNGSSWTDAYTNIQTAINASISGDTILIKTGTYAVVSQLYIGSGTNLTIRGGYAGSGAPGAYTNDPGATIVDALSGSRRPLRIDNAGGWVEGLTFMRGYPSEHGGGVYLSSATTVFTNCVMRNNAQPHAEIHGGGVYVTGGSPTFDSCLIQENDVSTYGDGGGIYVTGAAVLMRNCVVRGNRGKYVGGGGAYFTGSTTSRMVNCLVVLNMHNSDTAGDGIEAQALSIENCTVIGNTGIGIKGGAGVTISNSIVWGHATADITGLATNNATYSVVQDTAITGAGVVHGDPRFEFGYYLGAGSSGTNAGFASAASLGLDSRYAQASQADSETVDLGYHYPQGYTLTLTNLYVDAARPNDSGDGLSPGTAFKTLTNALARAAVGTTINVATGTYNAANGETFPLLLNKEALRIVGANASATVINAGSANRVFWVDDVSDQALLSTLTIRGGNGAAAYGGGLYLDKTRIRIEDCVIRENTCARDQFGGGVYVWGGGPTLERCVLTRNQAGDGAYGYGGALASSDSALKLLSCQIRRNRSAKQSGGLRIEGGTPSRVFNCLVVNNYALGTGEADGIYASNLRIENSSIVGNCGIGVRWSGSGTLSISNSIVWGNGVDLDGVSTGAVSYSCVGSTNYNGAGMIRANPLFEYGYYLKDGSPCTNAGAATASALGLNTLYAQASQQDSGVVDLGYHQTNGYTLVVSNLYVDAARPNDTGDGLSWATAFKTLTKGLAQSQVGTTVYVATGTYNTANGEVFPLVVNKEAVRVIGTNAAATVIDAGSGSRAIYVDDLNDQALLSGLTVYRGNGAASYDTGHGGGLYLDVSRIRIEDCVIRDNKCARSKYGGGVYAYGGGPTLERCVFTNNQGGDLSYGNGGAIAADGSDLKVRSCVIRNNTSSQEGGGLYFIGKISGLIANSLVVTNSALGTYSGDGIYATAPLTILNCTVADNQGQGIYGTSGTLITNCILWANGDDLVGVTDTNKVKYTCIEDGDFIGTNGCVNADPQFVDRVYYHLKSTVADYRGGYFSGGTWGKSAAMSPLIDAGNPLSAWSNEPDYPKGKINMGAYGNTSVASRGPAATGAVIMIR